MLKYIALVPASLILIATVLLSARSARPPSVQAQALHTAVADAHVHEKRPAKNYGRAGSLHTGRSPLKKSYLRFDVQGLEGTVTKATLYLHALDPSATGFRVRVVNRNNWDETTLTFKNAPALGRQIGAVGGTSDNSWTSIDVTSVVKGNGSYSFALVKRNGKRLRFSSRESGANAPRLVISIQQPNTSTPTPVHTTTPTSTHTATPTDIATSTHTATPTDITTSTHTATPTDIATSTHTATPTDIATSTHTATPTDIATSTHTATPTLTPTSTDTATSTHIATPTLTSTSTDTATLTHTATSTDIALPMSTNTATSTPTDIASPTSTDIATSTPTDIATPTHTATSTDIALPTSTNTATSTPTDIASPTSTDIATPTPTDIATPTSTHTATPTHTATLTHTPSPIAPVFVGAGDIADCNTNNDEATAKLLDAIPGSVFTLGDNAYPDGTSTDFAQCYESTWGRHKARTRPSPGNHDYHTANASGYFGYFGAAAGDPTKGYYSYNLGSWHIIALNSELDATAGSAQEQWLRADLAANPNLCTLAYWHRPLFSSGSHGNDPVSQALWQALYDAGADVILGGHDHHYERFNLQKPNGALDTTNGIRQFVVGTGGRALYALGTIQPNSQVRNTTTMGVLKLTLNPTSYDWQFVPIAGQTFSDTGSQNCH